MKSLTCLTQVFAFAVDQIRYRGRGNAQGKTCCSGLPPYLQSFARTVSLDI